MSVLLKENQTNLRNKDLHARGKLSSFNRHVKEVIQFNQKMQAGHVT